MGVVHSGLLEVSINRQIRAKEKAGGPTAGLFNRNRDSVSLLFADPGAEPGFYLPLVPWLDPVSEGHHSRPGFVGVEHVVIGRDAGSVESDERPVGYEITPGGQTVVEMVGGDVSQVSQRRRQQQRVIINEAHQ